MEFLEVVISLIIILMALKIVETILAIASFWSDPIDRVIDLRDDKEDNNDR